MEYTISAVILAGGKARRMNGADKGLQLLQDKPLISHVIERLQPQVIDISINANRHHAEYAQWGFPVFSDELPDFQGPLSGMLTALEQAKTDFVLFVPCDSPYFPQNLLEKLKSAVKNDRTLMAYAKDKAREHPTFCLMSVQLKEKLRAYLNQGERRLLQFMNKMCIRDRLYALAPLIPLVILVIGGTSLQQVPGLEWTKMGVPQAMLIGAIYGIIVTRISPVKITEEFFNGMGNSYANVLGIIIAASVFVAGLKSTGAVDAAISFLKESNEFVRWGATIGPFLMGLITGSGDAAAIAFNTAVTPHAVELGYTHVNLGMAAAIAGALGRTASPIAGVTIVCAGLAMVSPVEMVKRTAPGMILAVLFLALFML